MTTQHDDQIDWPDAPDIDVVPAPKRCPVCQHMDTVHHVMFLIGLFGSSAAMAFAAVIIATRLYRLAGF